MNRRPLVFLASGTRGDVQPVIALALGLREAGEAVRIAAPPAFGAWITSFGIPFASIDGNPSELMAAPGGQSALTFDGNPIRSLLATRAYLRRARPLYARMLASAAEACRNARALVIGLPTVWGAHIAEWLGLPLIGAFTQPVTPTGDFPSPLIPFASSLGRSANRLTYPLAAQATFLPWRGVINDWRKRHGLHPLSAFGFTARLDTLIYGFSRHIVPPPSDWPPGAHVTGAWTLPQNHVPHFAHPALESFLSDGPPPLYFTFGSPGAREMARMLGLITEAVRRLGMRAVVSVPPDFSALPLPPFLFPLATPVPHPWLFPRLGGVVHHGGAGTTAAGLMAGLPTLALPLAVDQFFWGRRVWDLGVGPRPIPQRALTAHRLAGALAEMQAEGMQDRAGELAQKLGEEDGVAAASEQIAHALMTYV